MDSESRKVQIIYELVDKISAQMDKVQTSIEEANETADKSEGFNNLTGNIIKANLATQVLLAGLNLLRGALNEGGEILKAGARYEMLNESLNTTARNLGYTKEQLKGYYEELENANTFGSKATEVLKSLLQTGMIPMLEKLQFANGETGFKGLVLTMKDFAASAGVSSSQAMDDFTKAIQRLEPLLLDKYFTMRNLTFVYGDYADKIGKTLPELTEQEKRTAFLNEIVREGSIQMGVYAETYDTAGKNMLSLADISDSLKEEIGLQLQPAFKAVTNTLVTTLKGIRDLVKENPQLINQIVTVAAVVGGLVASFFIAGKAVAAVTMAITIAKGAFAALSVQITATQLAAGVLGLVLAAVGALIAKSFMDQVAAQQEANESTEELGQTTQDFFANAGAASDQYNEKLDDHVRKLKQIKDAIDEENAAFERQLADLIIGREQDLASNKKALDKELAQFNKAQEEKDKQFEENRTKIEEENEARLRNLEDTLGAELQIGSASYEQDLANYMAVIEQERQAGQKRLDDAVIAHQTETADAKAQMDERTSALQMKISEDEAFLMKHAEVVKGINRDVVKDELEQLQMAHQKRLETLQNQLTEAERKWGTSNDVIGNDWRDTIAGMNNQKLDLAGMIKPIDWGQVLGGAWTSLKSLVKQFLGGLAGAIVEIARQIALWIRGVVESIPVVGGEIAKHINNQDQINNLANKMLTDIAGWSGISANARGSKYFKGGLTLVGEEGPELVNLPQGSSVMSNRESSEMVGKSVNIGAINVYAAEGQSATEVASEVMDQINTLIA